MSILRRHLCFSSASKHQGTHVTLRTLISGTMVV